MEPAPKPNPASPSAPVAPSAPSSPPKRHRWLLYGCGSILALIVVIIATVGLTLWWIQRPIKPVVLSTSEKAAVDQKIQRLSGGSAPATSQAPAGGARPGPAAPTPNLAPAAGNRPSSSPIEAEQGDRRYVPGGKVLKLTEREINGLLNANTDLGQTVRLEFASDAINAYLAVPIPKDFPVGGGRMFRARGRFRVSLGNGGQPYAVLEDVTVFGLSLPKAWLGGLKGENLLGDVVGERKGGPVLRGIKSLRVEPGALVLEVED